MQKLVIVFYFLLIPFAVFSSGIPEKDFPWDSEITIIAKKAIFQSIENLSKPIEERKPNFPQGSDSPDSYFPYIESEDFKVIGYSFSDYSSIYIIEFHGIDFMGSGPRIAVEIDINTGEVFRVFILADA